MVDVARRIYVCGCAKSGTTLLRRLFWAFQGVDVIPGEIGIMSFCTKFPTDSQILVGKRKKRTVFSDDISSLSIKDQLRIIDEHGIEIVVIRRDKETVLSRYPEKISKKRYDACVEQQRRYADHIRLSVEYENLVADPDVMQTKIALTLGLRPLHAFSSYPDFVPQIDFENTPVAERQEKRYWPRRIGDEA